VTKTASIYWGSKNYPNRLSQGGTFETAVAAASFATDSGGWANYGIRVVIPSSAVLISGSTVKVQITAGAGEGLSLDGAYVGHQATSGDVYDFDGNQSQLLFSSSSSVAISAGTSETSDETTFSLDSSKNLIVAFGVKNDTAVDSMIFQTGTSFSAYQKSGGNGEEGTRNVTGYTQISAINRFSVNLIEAK